MSCEYCGFKNADCNKYYCDEYNLVKCKKCEKYSKYNTVYRYGCDDCCDNPDGCYVGNRYFANDDVDYPVKCSYCGGTYSAANIHKCKSHTEKS